ncbi:MAG TPA: TldD/PmbA family protein [Hyphomonadaceae bacterium]|jgi:PmbA protein|nr:TldD/PmbA family protein [Hyphomonadaceae bacterium]
MTSSTEDLLQSLIQATLRNGADAADARISESAGLSVEVRNGELESVEREESRGLSLRALVGRRQAHVSGTDLSPAALKAMSERVVSMAGLAPEDKWCGLPDASEVTSERPNLELDCDDTPEAPELERRAKEIEDAAMQVAGIKQMDHCGASWSTAKTWLAASNGFTATKSSGISSMAGVAISERDGAMERDYESTSERRKAKLRTPASIGKEAAERAAARLGARKIDSQTAPVIYENRLANRLLGAFIGAISGPAIARGTSFLKDKMGKQVFAKGVNIIDDPKRIGGFGSRGFDGEGRAVNRTALIDDGVLTQWLLSGPSARQLGLKPNGFSSTAFGDPPGVSPSNLDIQAGQHSLAQLMKDAGKGLLITDMFGPSLNPNTGDYSVGVSGFWFENGERAYPVSEVTVAGDLPSMFLRAVPGSDLDIRSSSNSPSLLIDGLALAGR